MSETKHLTVKEFVNLIEERKSTATPLEENYVKYLDNEEAIVPVFIVTYFLLHHNRRSYNKENKKLSNTNDYDTKVRVTVMAPLNDCTQCGILLASALFYFNQSSLSFKLKIIKHISKIILSGTQITVSELINSLKNNKPEDAVMDSSLKKPIITSLCMLSNATNDSSLASLACNIDFTMYGNTLLKRHDKWHSNAVVSCLFRQYLNQFIPKCDHDIKRKELHDEFSLNSEACLNKIITRFSLPAPTILNGDKLIDLDTEYEVYVGPLNYWKHITSNVKNFNGKLYTLVYYKSILYDVLAEDKQSLLRMPWNERLAKLPKETRINLDTMTGREISDIIATRESSNSITLMTHSPEYKTFNINVIKNKSVVSEVDMPEKKRKRYNDDELQM